MSLPFLRLASAAFFASLASTLSAQVTYVDASAANTSGSAFSSTANVYNDNLWSVRAIGSANSDAVNNTVLEAGPHGGSENVPVLATTLTGLTPGASYEVYVYFVTFPSTDTSQLWRIRAGFAADTLIAYDRDSAATSTLVDGSTSALADVLGNPITVPANRDYRQASLGSWTADGAGTITVYVDSGAGTNDQNHRTWYDGVGYKLAGAASVASGPPITVDPAGVMTPSWSAEWAVDGNAEGWTAVNATASVSGGTISATATAAGPSLRLSALSGGSDLDLGFNDFLDLRIRVPASYAGPIQIYYGTTSTTGFAGTRVITIPASRIPKDGAFHLYRVELGLEVYWRSTLRDLRVDLSGTSSAGATMDIDYLRVGDDPAAAVYQPRFTTECPATGGITPSAAAFGPGQTIYSLESKHFRILWNDAVAAHGSWTATRARNTLRNAEETWQVFIKKLGYREACFAIGSTSGTRYKTNITTWHSGYWAGPDTNYGRLNITPDGLGENPPSGVIPHEFMHVLQFHNTTGNVPGSWFEGHANYARERYLQHFRLLFGSTARSGIDPTYLRCAHQIIASGRDYYLSWPLFLYLDENPDGLPDLGEGTLAKLWQQTPANTHPLHTLDTLTPVSSLKDIVGYFARRQVTFNYASKADIQAALAGFGRPLDNAATQRWQFTDLLQRPDDPSWWRVPYEMAPMQGAYTIHELVPAGSGAGRVVTVNFRGLPDSARGADWRASLIVIADDGAERYGALFGNGGGSVTLAANENKLYLSVAGAPSVFHRGNGTGDYEEDLFPYRSHPIKTRFPYEIQVVGATPRQRDNGAPSGLVQHANGGGYKSSTANVASTAYIGPDARVLGSSTVSGNARIEDYAVVSGATVSGSAVVSGHALVRGGTVTDNAKVRDWALVEGGTINGSARVLERANIKGGLVTHLAVAKGTAASLSGTLSGNAIIDGDYGDFFYGRDVANAAAYGHLPYSGVPDSYLDPLPTAVYAGYDFASAHDSRILDQFGVVDGFTAGSPAWIAKDARRQGFLTFDGSSQYVLLDRSVADLRDFTFTAWVKPLGGPANQSVLWLGASATKRLFLTPSDDAGRARFSIVNGGAEQTLVAPAALPVGVWTHVAVTLDGSTGVLYLNGAAVASGPVTLRADQILAANTAVAPQHNYLARAQGSAMPFFRGGLDDVRFYAAALPASDIAAMQPASALAAAGTLHVDLSAADASAGSATWINNGTAGNFSAVNAPTKVANVASTGVPGVSFNGTSQAYVGPVTGADLDGASDRSIEVWVYNPSVTDEESMVSWSYRGTEGRALSFNYGSASTYNAVTHWGGNYDLGWGTTPAAGAWHHLVYTYDGALSAQVYVDGVLATAKTLPAALATFASQPINLGRQRDNAAGTTHSKFFGGFLNRVRIHGGVLTAAQVASNHSLGPAGAPANQAPTLAALPDRAVDLGSGPASVSITLGDTDTPLAALAVFATSAQTALVPAGNLVVTGTGATRTLQITPAAGSSGSTLITVTVSDGVATTTRTFLFKVRTASETWRQVKFGTDADSGDAADLADPDRDGLANLLEFYLGGEPLASDSATNLPLVARDGAHLTLTYTRAKSAAAELQAAVEWTADLATPQWSQTGVGEIVLVDDLALQTVKAFVPFGAASCFMRLRVGRP